MLALFALLSLSLLEDDLPSLLSISSKSLVSFFGGVVVAAQITSVDLFKVGSSVAFKDSFQESTRTTAVILDPTRCALSNGTVSSPSLLFFGYFIIVFASLVCTFGAKGFFKSPTSPPVHPVPDAHRNGLEATPPSCPLSSNHPPPPPPIDPASETDPKLPRKRLFPWAMILLVIVIAVLATILAFRLSDRLSDNAPFVSVAFEYTVGCATKIARIKALIASSIPDVPRARIFTLMGVASMAISLYCFVAFAYRGLRRKADYYMRSLFPAPDLPHWLRSFGIYSCIPGPVILASMRAADFYFDLGLFHSFDNGYILTTTLELIRPFICGLPDVFSLLETLMIFGPAAALATMLLLHTVLWFLGRLLMLVRKIFFADAEQRAMHAVIERASPLWNSLDLGFKMVLIGPAMVHYLRYYIVPALFALVARIQKVKARARWRLGS
ncbi:hypothetical protein C8J57DRAFT_1709613 [Mycena rebaudengoi]|nr:hypothetical protein C8J57DRAFT_1709613 [Mycena rebaudengoi]